MAPRVVQHPGTRPTARQGETVDERSLAHSGHQPHPDVQEEETPHFCYDGWVYLGYEGVDEDGELAEVATERLPCRRCQPETRYPRSNTYGCTGLRLGSPLNNIQHKNHSFE
jgi:hypothetical protein